MGFADAVNHAKMRVDIEGAKIWRPLMDLARSMQHQFEPPANCDYDNFFQCWSKDEGQKDLFSLWSGKCAEAYNCVPPRMWEQNDRAERLAQRVMQQAGNLNNKIISDMQRAMGAY